LFDLMEATDPELQKCLNELKRAVIALDWTLQPWSTEGEEPTAEALARKQFVEELLWQMRPDAAEDENDFEDTLRDVLDAWGKGLSVLEVLWKEGVPVSGGFALAPRATMWVHPRYYGFPPDKAGLRLNMLEISTARAMAGGATAAVQINAEQWAPFAENKFLLCSAKQKSGHPIGSALLRALAWWWCVSNFSAGFLVNFAQIFGLPIRWATYDVNQPGILKKVCEMLANMGTAAWGAFPSGTTLELKEASKGGADHPAKTIRDMAREQYRLLILGQTLTSAPGESGSYALGQVQKGVRGGCVDAAANFAAKVINYQLIPAICRLNFGNDRECPWFSPVPEEQDDQKLRADVLKVLADLGLEYDEQWLRETFDVPPVADGAKTVGGRAPQPQLPGLGNPQFPAPGRNGNGKDEEQYEARGVPVELVRTAVADSVGARRQWLAPINEEIDRLARLAKNQQLTDEEFTAFVTRARGRLPELFSSVDVEALADSLESALGAAALEGVRDGLAERKLK